MCLEKLSLNPAGPFAVRDLNLRLDPNEAIQGPQSRRASRRMSTMSRRRSSHGPRRLSGVPETERKEDSVSKGRRTSHHSAGDGSGTTFTPGEKEGERQEDEVERRRRRSGSVSGSDDESRIGSSGEAVNVTKEPLVPDDPAQVIKAPEQISHIFGETNFLLPGDVRQYLYLLHPKDDESVANALTSHALGKLDIVWRFSFGETGRLQTSQLTRRVPVADAIQVITRRVQEDVQVERPFTIDLRIFNRTDAPMKLQLSAVKAKMGAVLMRGQASRALGEVRPQGDVECTIEFLPLAPGLHTVSGVRVSDYISGESRDIEVAEVFVTMGPTVGGGGGGGDWDEEGWDGEEGRRGMGSRGMEDARLMGNMPSESGDHGWSQVGGGFTKRRLTLTRPTLSGPEGSEEGEEEEDV